MADKDNTKQDSEAADQTEQSIFDLFEPPPDPDPNSFGKIPVVREDEIDLTDGAGASTAEIKAAAEAEAAGLQHWTAPATGQVPAVLSSEGEESGLWGDVKGPSWHGDDPAWAGPDLADVFADTDAVSLEAPVDELDDVDDDDDDDDEDEHYGDIQYRDADSTVTGVARRRPGLGPQSAVRRDVPSPGAPASAVRSPAPNGGPAADAPEEGRPPRRRGPDPDRAAALMPPDELDDRPPRQVRSERQVQPREPGRRPEPRRGEARPGAQPGRLGIERNDLAETAPPPPGPGSKEVPGPPPIRRGPDAESTRISAERPSRPAPEQPGSRSPLDRPVIQRPALQRPALDRPARERAAPGDPAGPAERPSVFSEPRGVPDPPPAPGLDHPGDARPAGGDQPGVGVDDLLPAAPTGRLIDDTDHGQPPSPTDHGTGRRRGRRLLGGGGESRRGGGAPIDADGPPRQQLFSDEPPALDDIEFVDDGYDDYDQDELAEEFGLGSGGRNVPVAIAVGLGLAAVVLVAMWFGPDITMVLVGALALLAVLEVYNAMRMAGLRPATLLGIVGAVAAPAAAYYRGDAAFPLIVALAVVFGVLWYLVGADTERPVLNFSLTMMGIFWVGGLAAFAALMLRNEGGVELLLATIIITVASDTMAYVGGRAYGKRPFHHASPNKTWEGTLTGLAGAVFAGAAIGITEMGTLWDGNFIAAVALGAVVGVLAPIGDLAESVVKRDLGIKDMGTLLPGHGGVMDRIDALLFALPGAYYLGLIAGLF